MAGSVATPVGDINQSDPCDPPPLSLYVLSVRQSTHPLHVLLPPTASRVRCVRSLNTS